MIRALFLLLSLQLAGEAVAGAFDLAIPGPVLGMAALFLILTLRRGAPETLETTARGFLDHLGLLFVPAGVGVTLHLAAAAEAWRAIAAAVVVGTLVAMVATALVFGWLSRLAARRGGEGTDADR